MASISYATKVVYGDVRR